SATRWILRTVSTAPTISAPTNLQGTPGAAGSRTFAYQVTAAAAETFEESVPCGPVSVANAAEPTVDAPHAITWDAVAGAAEYYVYGDLYGNGSYGYLGTATGTSFNDVGLEPDFAVTPPIPRVLFQAAGNFPTTAAVYEQR